MSTPGYSPIVDRALAFSALAHEDKKRKGTLIPYVIHPMHVALILQRCGHGENLVVAALLHDVLEDMRFEDRALQARVAQTFPGSGLPVGVSADTFRLACLDFIGREFGADVLGLVQAVTEPKNDGGPPRSWRERREQQLAHLRDAGPDVAALKAADLIHNIISIVRDLRRDGPRVMDRFNAGPRESLWYYETAAQLAASRLPADDRLGREVVLAAQQLRALLDALGLDS